MSTASDEALEQELASILQSNFIGICCEMAVCVILVYDYMLTFGREVELFWHRPTRALGGTVIFMLNRVVAVGLAILGNIDTDLSRYTYASCKYTILVEVTITLLAYAVWGAVSAIRVHALTKRNWLLSMPTLALALVPMVADMPVALASASQEWYAQPPRRIAAGDYLLPLLTRNPLFLTGHLSVLAFINALEIILYLTSTTDYVNLFIAPISTIVISRFLLDIREAAYTSDTTFETTTSDLSISTPSGSAYKSRMWQSLDFATQTYAERSQGAMTSTTDVGSHDRHLYADVQEFEMGNLATDPRSRGGVYAP
ncbi:uncharacterized protein B0H18DRAFT_1119288 [Fomitopsis serialis]|uniref:uncharacterized protein n=1 Tax=Fomitopsis serialis TaxID=139415 RepID=UPI002007D450|nr:uncharacterized protein B0H18DRAFT_1119288 [Neoantrodia serialis]KAH9925792.1 hypothetical protein B0H18DRAFT_1119288 [Neoantrodia serialis]